MNAQRLAVHGLFKPAALALRLRRLCAGSILLSGILLAGCAQVFSLGAEPGLPPETAIALTVAAYPLPTLPPETQVPPPPTSPPAPQPTYTPLPTYTHLPTYTPQPTYTLPPTYTPLPTEPAPVINPAVKYYEVPAGSKPERPYVLRVRNQNTKTTLWIGTTLPYGGNFIKPLHYVEFYPPGPQWMRIWWCRRGSFFPGWENRWWRDWEEHWDDPDTYSCSYQDFLVDEPFQEVGVK